MGVKLGLSWRMFENRELRKIFGPKRKEVAGGDCINQNCHFRILHSTEGISTLT
jgi:hypothetical protein